MTTQQLSPAIHQDLSETMMKVAKFGQAASLGHTDEAEQLFEELRAEIDAQPSAVTDEQIRDVATQWTWTNMSHLPDNYIQFARAILALRPVQVPMTDEQIDYLKRGPSQSYQEFARAVEAHHGITSARKGGE